MKVIDIVNAPWAIGPEYLTQIVEIYETHLKGPKIDLEEIKALRENKIFARSEKLRCLDSFVEGKENNKHFGTINGDIAIIPIMDVLSKRMNLFSNVSGGTSTQLIARDFKEALNDEDIKTILLDVDSPGGSVDGTFELAELIFNSRGKKPIIAFTDGMIASAALWDVLGADYVFISGPTTNVGNLGVVATHKDVSKRDEIEGIKITEIVSGKFKRPASQHKPLSKEGVEHIQGMVDQLTTAFVSDIAKFRGISVDEMSEDVVNGKMFIGEKAIEVGLVDGVKSFDALISEIGNGEFSTEGRSINQQSKENIMAEDEKVPKASITSSYVAVNHPEIAKELKDQGFSEGKAEGVKEGAENERNRVMGIRAQTVVGYEAEIEKMIADGTTTPGDAAMKIVGLVKKEGSGEMEKIKKEAKEDTEIPQTQPHDYQKPKESKTGSVEDQAKAAWDGMKEKAKADYSGFDAFKAEFINDKEEGRD